MKHIGMLVAMEMDAVHSRYGQADRVEQRCGFTIHHYDREDCCLHVMHAGVGELAAAAATQLLIDRYAVELVVNFGVVGGLTEAMAQTETCVVEKLCHYDFDLSGIDPVVPGQYPGYEDVFLPTDRELVEKALAIEPRLKKVVCASADKFVSGREAKSTLHERFGADICEMEAAGVVLTCRRSGVPCLLIKTVSDGISGGGEEFYQAVQRTSAQCLAVADRVIREL